MHYKTIKISSTCRGKPPDAQNEAGSWLDDRMQSMLALEWPPGVEEELQPVPVQMQEGMYCARSGLGAGDGENGQADAATRRWGDKPRWRHGNSPGIRDALHRARSTLTGLSGYVRYMENRDGPFSPHPILEIGTWLIPARDWIFCTCPVHQIKIRDRDNDIERTLPEPPEKRWRGRGVLKTQDSNPKTQIPRLKSQVPSPKTQDPSLKSKIPNSKRWDARGERELKMEDGGWKIEDRR